MLSLMQLVIKHIQIPQDQTDLFVFSLHSVFCFLSYLDQMLTSVDL